MTVSKRSAAFQRGVALPSLARFAEAPFEHVRREPLSHILSAWRERRQYRQELQRLMKVGPHMIADNGLKLEDARMETAKPFWQK
jgi:uncharacterized protein YjiS (DUF1127 family)